MDTHDGYGGDADSNGMPIGWSGMEETPPGSDTATGNGWGNGWENDFHGGDGTGDAGDGYVDKAREQLVRTDPVPGDLRHLVTNTLAFAHLWREK